MGGLRALGERHANIGGTRTDTVAAGANLFRQEMTAAWWIVDLHTWATDLVVWDRGKWRTRTGLATDAATQVLESFVPWLDACNLAACATNARA